MRPSKQMHLWCCGFLIWKSKQLALLKGHCLYHQQSLWFPEQAKALPKALLAPSTANPAQNAKVLRLCSALPEDPLSPFGAHRPLGLSLLGAEQPPPTPNWPPELGRWVPWRYRPGGNSSPPPTSYSAAPVGRRRARRAAGTAGGASRRRQCGRGP